MAVLGEGSVRATEECRECQYRCVNVGEGGGATYI